MSNSRRNFRRLVLPFAALFLAVPAATLPSSAAIQARSRIAGPVQDADRVTLPGTHSPRARAGHDAGALAASTRLENMTLVFSRTAAQQADLDALLASLQDRTSPQFHQWLTPAQFADRFGLAPADVAKASAWLEERGFQVTGTSNSRDRIFFSGTAAQVNAAFSTELHQFSAAGETHFAPVGDLSVPAALANVVLGVGNVSSFRPRPHVRLKPAVNANFTSGQSGSHFLTPKDLATIYDINAAYNAGYNGSGQSIVVVGQSAVVPADIAAFQTAAGVPVRPPTMVLVPGTGTSAVSSGDETESDLDLEYTSGVATGANVSFVYTGNNQNYGVFDALQYAVDHNLAPIISVSYGDCETNLSSSDFAILNGILAQAAAQGQTVVVASGDSGSTDCYVDKSLTTAQREALSADFPSDSQYVTGVGGTMFTAAAVAKGSTYWQSNGSDIVGSAISYMPEQVWNNDTSAGISSGGGGVSVFAPRPTWQAGVPGIGSGNYRLTPDISLAASPDNAGYLYCSSDSASTGITGSCANGFRDGANTYLTVAGGTSFAAPVFAGMLAILNSKLHSTGQGLINPTLYTLASKPSTYASAFHDITVGSNACTGGTTICSTEGAGSFLATVGYDSASGLGSLDFFNLLTVWPTTVTGPSVVASTTTLNAATLTPASGAADAVTITVASGSSSTTATPTGTLLLTVDGVTVNAALPVSANGTATYSFSSTAPGGHFLTATYSGDATYAASTGTLTLTVPSAAGKSFAISGNSITVVAGASGSTPITVTPANGYTGTVSFTVTTSALIPNLCYTLPNNNVASASAAATLLTVYTSASTCAANSTATPLRKPGGTHSASVAPGRGPGGTRNPVLAELGAAALLAVLGLGRRRARALRPLLALAGLAALGVSLSGCGQNTAPNLNTTTNNTQTLAAPGTYTLTVKGTDTTTNTITSSTTVALVIN